MGQTATSAGRRHSRTARKSVDRPRRGILSDSVALGDRTHAGSEVQIRGGRVMTGLRALTVATEVFLPQPLQAFEGGFMTTRSVAVPQPASLSSKDRTLVGASALLTGLALLFLVGFAPIAAVHNAAHDTRHSAAFPCH
jgi:cobalt transporter subunit CbtB